MERVVPESLVGELRRRAGLTRAQLAQGSGLAERTIAAYEAGTRSPSAEELARLRESARPRPSFVLAQHRAAILRLAAGHKALDVKVFGSVARGEDGPGSDIDLLVTFRPDASLFDQIALTQAVEDLVGLPVDIISDGGLPADRPTIRDQARPL